MGSLDFPTTIFQLNPMQSLSPLIALSAASLALAAPSEALTLAPQGASALFDDNALTVLDAYSRFELALDTDADGRLEMVDWWPYLSTFDVVSVGMHSQLFYPGVWDDGNHTVTAPDGTYEGNSATEVGDFDGDGDDEFILVARTQIDVFDRFGPQFRRRLAFTPLGGLTGNCRGAEVLDFNGDGRDDFVIVDGSLLRFFESTSTAGSFAFTETGSVPSSDLEIQLGTADVSGSASPELFVLVPAASTIPWIPGPGPVLWVMDVDGGQLRSAERFDVRSPEFGAPVSLALGDVDMDGDTDAVLFGHDGRFQTLRRDGAIWTLTSDAVGGPATDLADLDGDGDLDGICCGSSGGSGSSIANDTPSTFHLCLNDGSGGFDQAVAFAGIGGHHVAAAIDWDRDGDIDVVGGRSLLLNKTFVGASYCPGATNSTGQEAVAYATGAQSEAAGGVHLYGSGLPPGATCILLTREIGLGGDQTSYFFWDGQLCIGGSQIARRSVGFADLNGHVDLGSRATWTSPLCCQSGWGGERVWGYQIWYRDVTPGGTGANISSALSVIIAR